jgi:hypothetical protein
MPHPEVGAFANLCIMKLAAVSAALAMLGGCAIVVPLRPLAMSSQAGHNNASCTVDPKCPNASTDRRIAHRQSPPVRGKIEDDPPDFIVNSAADQDGRLR